MPTHLCLIFLFNVYSFYYIYPPREPYHLFTPQSFNKVSKHSVVYVIAYCYLFLLKFVFYLPLYRSVFLISTFFVQNAIRSVSFWHCYLNTDVIFPSQYNSAYIYHLSVCRTYLSICSELKKVPWIFFTPFISVQYITQRLTLCGNNVSTKQFIYAHAFATSMFLPWLRPYYKFNFVTWSRFICPPINTRDGHK